MTARGDPWAKGRWRAARGTAPGLRSLLDRGEWQPLGEGTGRYRVETPRGSLFALRRDRGAGRCRRAFRRAIRLHHQGIPMPAPLGLFWGPGGTLVYVSEWCDDLVAWPDSMAEAADPLGVAAALATLLARVHEAGFVCGDPCTDLAVRARCRGGSPVVLRVERLRRAWGRRRDDRDLARFLEGLPARPEVRAAAARAYARARGEAPP